jgi:hypothetical protein
VYELQDVPHRSLIKIHAANKATDVAGCIAPGYMLHVFDGQIGVADSHNALLDFHASLNQEDAVLLVTNTWRKNRE